MRPDPIDEYDDFDLPEEDGFDPAEECGRWRNGQLAPYHDCLMAGTEFCDWDCPYSRPGTPA